MTTTPADLKASLFTTGPPPTPTATLIDWATLTPPMPGYATPAHFCLLLDGVFTPAECASLIAYAETQGAWELAMVNVGGGHQRMIADIRNCGRIMLDDAEIADQIWSRVRPHLEEEVGTLENGEDRPWKAIDPQGLHRRWRMKRLNERLRFLKYGPGEYFRQHCDGQYVTPDRREFSWLTLQLYLNEECEGGATRFYDGWGASERVFDVAPKTGRVVVFQHKGLLHSGEELASGVKVAMRTDIMYEEIPGANPQGDPYQRCGGRR